MLVSFVANSTNYCIILSLRKWLNVSQYSNVIYHTTCNIMLLLNLGSKTLNKMPKDNESRFVAYRSKFVKFKPIFGLRNIKYVDSNRNCEFLTPEHLATT